MLCLHAHLAFDRGLRGIGVRDPLHVGGRATGVSEGRLHGGPREIGAALVQMAGEGRHADAGHKHFSHGMLRLDRLGRIVESAAARRCRIEDRQGFALS